MAPVGLFPSQCRKRSIPINAYSVNKNMIFRGNIIKAKGVMGSYVQKITYFYLFEFTAIYCCPFFSCQEHYRIPRSMEHTIRIG